MFARVCMYCYCLLVWLLLPLRIRVQLSSVEIFIRYDVRVLARKSFIFLVHSTGHIPFLTGINNQAFKTHHRHADTLHYSTASRKVSGHETQDLSLKVGQV
ncbi:uncharacterized protein HD556DRAFT_1381203 [Suillus plorans]|uniref:Secreted protein n=1 Tax=Suillus plorans TaxID=116603 RepID=A0A9P7AM26_9AGAM|nr:uncharacterized protein HD556DRAFT_1381203 [Suillus plorans]KAG1792161.1 hypothetical protein HD556DRAFT_1381203 [Suillus plorans]